jgi:bromodomain-containing factor 1
MNNAHQNGDNTPLVAVTNGLNGISAKVYPSSNDNHPSPATDSPATPLPIIAPPDVKIDIDYQEQESDVRHEPLPVKHIDSIDKFDNASAVPQLATQLDHSMLSFVMNPLLSHFFPF